MFELEMAGVHEGRPAQYFKCRAPVCQWPNVHGYYRYTNGSAKATTSWLLEHACKCWGDEVFDCVMNGELLQMENALLKEARLDLPDWQVLRWEYTDTELLYVSVINIIGLDAN